MTRSRFLVLASALILIGIVAGCATRPKRPAAKRRDRPNLVLLLADDLGYGDLSCYGHPTIRTPHLDQMARDGIRFTSFYSASPACTAARASLLTGRYAIRSGLERVIMPDSNNGLPTSEITLAEALKARGYRTAAVGKWHLGHTEPTHFPTAHGFDSYLGLIYSNDMIPPWVQTDLPLQLYRDESPIEHPVDASTLTKRYTEEAVRFIAESKRDPFFLYLSYNMPHVPIATFEKFQGRSKAGLYGDVVEGIDWSAGKVLEALKRHGLDENTLVVFASDNGPWLNMPERMFSEGIVKPWHAGSTGGLRGGKATTYEGGFRVPGILRWPSRIKTEQVSSVPVNTMDLYSTFIAAAGGEIPQDRPVDGRDLLPMLIRNRDLPVREFFYLRDEHVEAIRQGKWKLRLSNHSRDVDPEQPPTPELFDLDVDPGELYNRASDFPEVVRLLREKMVEFATETGARF